MLDVLVKLFEKKIKMPRKVKKSNFRTPQYKRENRLTNRCLQGGL
jgi:hypothetical protein